jgi:hypothetical protein
LATRHFEASLEILASDELGADVTLALSSHRHGFVQRFRLRTRAATAEDYAAAGRAEAHGRSGGMSALAARCRFVWTLLPLDTEAELATLNLSGILAAVALGPVLPADESALYGVRGSMERLDTLAATGSRAKPPG